MQEPPNEGPQDWFFDPAQQMWLRHSGRSRWRKILAERRAYREEHAAEFEAFRDRLRREPWALE